MDDVKTGEKSMLRMSNGEIRSLPAWHPALRWRRVRFWLEHGTWEPVASMPREKPKWKPHEGQSTDAGHRGGWACSSEEVPVMGMERRACSPENWSSRNGSLWVE